MDSQPFGVVDGQSVYLYELESSGGLQATISNYGGIIQRILAPDRHETLANVALGFSSLHDYVTQNPFFGATIGRFANRIAYGKFTIDGTTYSLPINNGPHSLHGGPQGFHAQVWHVAESSTSCLRLTRTSPDGEQGYPGTLNVALTYTLEPDNTIRIDYEATTDQPTIINLTNHTYFNLRGESAGDILDHLVHINAEAYTPIDASLIPTGTIEHVAGTPFDFRAPTPIRDRIRDGVPQLAFARGYDHNFVLRPEEEGLKLAARVEEPTSHRALEAWTTEPGLQFYTGNFLDATLIGSGGTIYRQGDGFTLETQHFPDSPNHPNFPTTELRPGQAFTSTTLFRFSVA